MKETALFVGTEVVCAIVLGGSPPALAEVGVGVVVLGVDCVVSGVDCVTPVGMVSVPGFEVRTRHA